MHKLLSHRLLRAKQTNRWQNQNKDEIISSQVILSHSVTRGPVRPSLEVDMALCAISQT